MRDTPELLGRQIVVHDKDSSRLMHCGAYLTKFWQGPCPPPDPVVPREKEYFSSSVIGINVSSDELR